MRPLANLQRLELFGSRVGDAGLEHLTALRKLEWIEICSGNVTGAASPLSPVQRHPDSLCHA